MTSETTKGRPTPRIANPLDPALAKRLAAARTGDQLEFGGLAEPYRRELQVHCYRILGSLPDAEDMVQETLLRAWRRLDTYEGRASFRAWLYKIATNACLDALDRRRAPKRALPSAARPPADPRLPFAPPGLEPIWLEPFPDAWFVEAAASPEARYTARESISLAFLVALQLLSARQRAALILCDVLSWPAREVAEMLELTVSAVNSALHRARTTLARHYPARDPESVLLALPADETMRALLHRYVQAWEAADVAGLVALLKEDVAFTMPPSPSWYRGRTATQIFVAATIFGDNTIFAGIARGRWRLLPVQANGQPAFAMYQRDDAGGYRAFGVQVLVFAGDGLAEVHNFLTPSLVTRFGLPEELKT